MKPLVGIVMGSKSDWETMEHASQTLDKLGEIRIPTGGDMGIASMRMIQR